MNEFDIIAEFFAPLATDSAAFGLKDDAAAIPARPGFDTVITTDTITQGTDFFPHDPPGMVAQKALRVNLSDLAAKGAVPAYYFLNLVLPHSVTRDWLKSFTDGLARDQHHFGISLLGGDTSSGDLPAVSVTALGYVPGGMMLRRNGARPGDIVYVTGSIGDSAGGLAIFKLETHTLNEVQRDHLIARYRVPDPPVAFGAMLRGLASASVDVSDGLIADLDHMASASGVAITVDAEKVPRSDALRAFWGDDPAAILRAVTAGDDYQIAFTAPPQTESKIMAAAKAADIAVTAIGTVDAGQGVTVAHRGNALAIPKPGYKHF